MSPIPLQPGPDVLVPRRRADPTPDGWALRPFSQQISSHLMTQPCAPSAPCVVSDGAAPDMENWRFLARWGVSFPLPGPDDLFGGNQVGGAPTRPAARGRRPLTEADRWIQEVRAAVRFFRLVLERDAAGPLDRDPTALAVAVVDGRARAEEGARLSAYLGAWAHTTRGALLPALMALDSLLIAVQFRDVMADTRPARGTDQTPEAFPVLRTAIWTNIHAMERDGKMERNAAVLLERWGAVVAGLTRGGVALPMGPLPTGMLMALAAVALCGWTVQRGRTDGGAWTPEACAGAALLARAALAQPDGAPDLRAYAERTLAARDRWDLEQDAWGPADPGRRGAPRRTM